MTNSSPQRPGSIACPSCGLVQEASRSHCSQCGAPFVAPSQIYLRQADGTWSPLAEIDLAALAPKPLAPKRRLNRKKIARLGLLVIIPGLLLNIWAWWLQVRATRQETSEIEQYLNNPVGRIVPRLQVQPLRGPAGEVSLAGQTNLPDGTLLEVQVYAGQLLVAVDYPVTVRGGRFQTRSLLERGRPFTPGTYRVRVGTTFEGRAQPPSVLRVVGPRGERLEGANVQRTDPARGARTEFAENVVLSE